VTVQLTINGERRELADALSVGELLQTLALTASRVAVEVNEEVVPRGTYDDRRLAPGDRVEIVQFVGGG